MAIDQVFKALSDPGRRQMLALLRRNGSMSLGDLAGNFDFSLPTLSIHMKLLTEAGLVLREKRGRHVNFSINTSVTEDLQSALLEILGPCATASTQRRVSVRKDELQEHKT